MNSSNHTFSFGFLVLLLNRIWSSAMLFFLVLWFGCSWHFSIKMPCFRPAMEWTLASCYVVCRSLQKKQKNKVNLSAINGPMILTLLCILFLTLEHASAEKVSFEKVSWKKTLEFFCNGHYSLLSSPLAPTVKLEALPFIDSVCCNGWN